MNRNMRIWLAQLSLSAYFTHPVLLPLLFNRDLFVLWFAEFLFPVKFLKITPLLDGSSIPVSRLYLLLLALSFLTTCYISMSRRKSKIISAAIHLFNLWAAASGRSQCVQSCSIIHARRSLVFLVPHTGGEKHCGSDVCGKWCYSTFVILSVNLSLWWCVYIELNELYCHITATRQFRGLVGVAVIPNLP